MLYLFTLHFRLTTFLFTPWI